MTRRPTRRTVKRALERLENDDGDDGDDGDLPTGPRERKAYIGRHPAENMPLPEDAREHVEQRALAFGDAEEAAESIDTGPTGAMGWDAETAASAGDSGE